MLQTCFAPPLPARARHLARTTAAGAPALPLRLHYARAQRHNTLGQENNLHSPSSGLILATDLAISVRLALVSVGSAPI